MVPSTRFLLFAWIGLLCIGSLKIRRCNGDGREVRCNEMERKALLKFKESLIDSDNRLSSWVGEDCCRWRGIRCNNQTGHVVKINLRNRPPSLLSSKYVVLLDEGDGDDDLAIDCMESCLSGEISPSLLELRYLNHLDLSMNDFGGTGIPKFIGSLKNLRYLNLSRAGFSGRVPHEIGNLSSLHSLDLNGLQNLHVDTLDWLSDLSSLQYLGMGAVDLSEVADWLQPINMLPFIRHLHLYRCRLHSIPTSLSYVNFTFLSHIDLSENMFGPTIPTWLFNISGKMLAHISLHSNQFREPIPTELGSLCNLQSLDLKSNNFSGEMDKFEESLSGCIQNSLLKLDWSGNKLSGYLPNWLGKFTSLKVLSLGFNSFSGPIPPCLRHFTSLNHLDLSGNSLSGSIPTWLGQLHNLTFLDLSKNSLSGPIPASLGNLTSLENLYLRNNQIDGPVPESLGQLSELCQLNIANNFLGGILSEAHFSNLTKLKRLFIFSNSLVFNVSSSWVPPFQLEYMFSDDCKSGPQFPSWLRTQKNLIFLSMSNASISDTIPHWFWNISSNIQQIFLSQNQLSGWLSLEALLPNLIHLDLSDNSISGSIFTSIGLKMPNLMKLSLSSNRFNGAIPLSVCKMNSVEYLSLSMNHLSNEIPSCIEDLQSLESLDLGNNDLSGNIPTSIGNLPYLSSLHLSNNKLVGKLPPSLCNITSLVTLDLGGNGFLGTLPACIGESLSSLQFLILRSNKLDGILPSQLSQLAKLQVLDLAENKLSGTIPVSYGNFSAMTVTNKTNEVVLGNFFGTMESISVYWKGRHFEYSRTVSLVMNLDLSNNNLSGEIPEEITHLHGLQSLNLSENHLTGTIPKQIGDMQMMESLDLSRNRLSAVIPNSLLSLTYLNHLNLSYNNLSGRIPQGRQLGTLEEPSIYMGNPNLCGTPLPNRCPGDETTQNPQLVDDRGEAEEGLEMEMFFIGMGPGFVAGFWVLCGILLFKRTWRIAYFRFFDNMGDRLYVGIARKVAKFQIKKEERTLRYG